jgi:GNAT superfamily N-acetyltransferase
VENRVDLREVGYNHRDVAALVAEVQQEYVRRYGGEDTTPLVASLFVPPEGHFVVVYLDGDPVAMGGWRRHDEARDGPVPGARPAEIKRMYVTPRARGRGLARTVLATLERSAGDAGCDLMVLETGLVQPEALALYRSAGYTDIPPFGHYADSDKSVHLAKPLRHAENAPFSDSGTEPESRRS